MYTKLLHSLHIVCQGRDVMCDVAVYKRRTEIYIYEHLHGSIATYFQGQAAEDEEEVRGDSILA